MTSDPGRTNTNHPQETVVGYDLTVLDRGHVSSISLPPRGRLIVGRDAEAGVQLVGPRVSRRHAALIIEPEGFAIEDLNSSNGTVLNRTRVTPGRLAPVTPGDSIHVGDFILIVRPRYAHPETKSAGVLVSAKYKDVLEQVAAVAPSDVNVLILGETGVGKDVLARRLHAESPRAKGPFIRINCAALSAGLLESELFGHERGAFSGAINTKPGLLEAASGGTVFLDEIGELPETLQPKLLHAVENREVMRVGSVQARSIDVRFVAATNRDLEFEVAEKRFRSDLFYRMSTFSIAIPPLRERTEDIMPLALELQRQASGGRPAGFDEAVIPLLVAYKWPGNVRELRNVIDRAIILAQGKRITADVLPVPIQQALLAPSTPPASSSSTATASHHPSLGVAPSASTIGALPRGDAPAAPPHDSNIEGKFTPKEMDERRQIIDALVRAHGNQSEAARQLGISRTTLLQRLDLYRISRPRKRPPTPV